MLKKILSLSMLFCAYNSAQASYALYNGIYSRMLSKYGCSKTSVKLHEADELLGVVSTSDDVQKIILGYVHENHDHVLNNIRDYLNEAGFNRLTANYYIISSRISPSGKYIVSHSNNNMLEIWNMATGKLDKLPGYCTSITHSPCDQYLACCSDNAVEILNMKTRKQIVSSYLGSGVFFSPYGKYVCCYDYGTVQIWNLETGKELITTRGPRAVFSKCNKYVTTAGVHGRPGTLSVWWLETGKLLQTNNRDIRGSWNPFHVIVFK